MKHVRRMRNLFRRILRRRRYKESRVLRGPRRQKDRKTPPQIFNKKTESPVEQTRHTLKHPPTSTPSPVEQTSGNNPTREQQQQPKGTTRQIRLSNPAIRHIKAIKPGDKAIPRLCANRSIPQHSKTTAKNPTNETE